MGKELGHLDEPVAPRDGSPADARIILAYVGEEHEPSCLLEAAGELARRLDRSWVMLHVERPGSGVAGGEAAAEALAQAAQLGANVASIAAATPADGIIAYLAQSPATHIFLPAEPRKFSLSRNIADRLVDALPGVALVLVSVPRADKVAGNVARSPARMRDYAIAAAAVLGVIPLIILLRAFIGEQALGLVFLLPVLGIAAQLGWRPSLLSSVLAVLAYNFFVLRPMFQLAPAAPQNWLMLAVLLGLSAYVSILTGRLRARLALSDRSAQENAALVAFGLELAKAGDWQSTARIVCKGIADILKVRTALYREVDSSIVLESAVPARPTLSPVDRAALDLAWTEGEATGAGTDRLSAADWQYQPLKTSLGLIAIVALAADDGRDPVRSDRHVLCSMLVTQAALAHERLRLEDMHAAQLSCAEPAHQGSA